MAEYITKDAVISLFEEWSDGYAYIEIPVKDAIRQVSAIPPADVRPVVRGRWVDEHIYKQTMSGKTYDGFTYCSNCKHDFHFGYRSKFCPNCWADMRGGESDG